jgi:hypothetical protein
MAAEREAQTDIKAHVSSYNLFSAMMKWGTILSFILTAIVVILISN